MSRIVSADLRIVPDLDPKAPLAEWAGTYARLGWAVLPLAPQDKRPLTAVAPHGLKDASSDPAVIERWWRLYPTANIGGVPASLGLIAVDIDSAEAERVATELGVFAEPAATVASGRTFFEGRHLYLRSPDPVRFSKRRLRGALEVVGDSNIVLPPSIHPSGQAYEWLVDDTEGWSQLLGVDPFVAGPPSPALLAQLHGAPTAPDGGGWVASPALRGSPIPMGARNDRLFRRASALRGEGASEAEILSRLLTDNQTIVETPLSYGEVRGIARSAAKYPAGKPAA